MKIKQVEELVGITSKNIRFYEDQGLLTPDRAENGYREYNQSNVATLKKIKILRKLGVSVEEIKSVLEEKTSLDDCLEKHMELLTKQQESILNMHKLAKVMLEKNVTINNIQTDDWLDEMEKMEKEGVDFVDLNKIDIHMKKKMGAVIGGAAVIAIMMIMIGVFIWARVVENMPVPVLLAMITGPTIVIICVIVAIRSRLKEIEGGEEDEASKY